MKTELHFGHHWVRLKHKYYVAKCEKCGWYRVGMDELDSFLKRSLGNLEAIKLTKYSCAELKVKSVMES